MNFQETPGFIKGSIGEKIVDDYLLAKGIIPYRPIADASHPFDRLCASVDKQTLYVAEVKTKPHRDAYPDTGINVSAERHYVNIAMRYGIGVFLYFVDERREEIYGGELISELQIPRTIVHNGKEIIYPWRTNGIVYFPLSAMKIISRLPADICLRLRALRRSSFNANHA